MMTNEFVEKNYKLIQYVASKVGNKLSMDDREDLINDTVIKLLDSDIDVNTDTASALVNRVMLNLLIDKQRHDAIDAMNYTESLDAPVDTDEPDGMLKHEVVPDKFVPDAGAKYGKDFKEICDALPGVQGIMMYRRYVLGKSPQEIADDLGYENNTVRRTLQRAKETLVRWGYDVS